MSKKHKIAVIGLKGLPALGGAASVGESIIKNSDSNIKYTIYSIDRFVGNTTAENNMHNLVSIKSFNNNLLTIVYYYFYSALHALFKMNFDLIHLHHGESAILIPILKLRYKVLITTHGAFQVREKWSRFKSILLILDKYFVKKADQVICVSQSEIKKFSYISNIKPLHIPNGINRDLKTATTLIHEKEYVFFSANRIIPSKGLHLLLKSLENIDYNGLVIIAGDIDQMPNYKTKIIKLFSNLNITYIGLIKEKEKLLSYVRYAKLFVFPSTEEAMSMMLLEAIAVGAKIICSDINENRDVLVKEEALFFKSGNIEDLSIKISYAITNYEIMTKKADLLIKNNIHRPDWHKIARQYNTIYNNLIMHNK